MLIYRIEKSFSISKSSVRTLLSSSQIVFKILYSKFFAIKVATPLLLVNSPLINIVVLYPS